MGKRRTGIRRRVPAVAGGLGVAIAAGVLAGTATAGTTLITGESSCTAAGGSWTGSACSLGAGQIGPADNLQASVPLEFGSLEVQGLFFSTARVTVTGPLDIDPGGSVQVASLSNGFSMSNRGTLVVGGDLSVSGLLVAGGNTTVSGAVTAGSAIQNGGTMVLDGGGSTGLVQNSAVLLQSGDLTGTGALANTGTLAIAPQSRLTVRSGGANSTGATIKIGTTSGLGGVLTVSGGDLQNGGRILEGCYAELNATVTGKGDVEDNCANAATAPATLRAVEGRPARLVARVRGGVDRLRWSAPRGCGIADPAARATTVRCRDDGVRTIRLTAVRAGRTVRSDTTLVVRNAAPRIRRAAFTPPVVAAGAPVGLAAAFGDAGVRDRHSVTIDWGDGSAPERVDGYRAGRRVEHVFTRPGTYTATVLVRDGDLGVDSAVASVRVS